MVEAAVTRWLPSWVTGPRVSKHWNPDHEIARWTQVDGYSPPAMPPAKTSWPRGATAGLVLVAAACLTVGVILYAVAGPREVVDENAAIDWDKVPGLPDPDTQD